MANNNVTVTQSLPLNKAQTVNSVATQFASFDTVNPIPSADGVWKLGSPGIEAAQRLILFPYAEAPDSSSFSVRLYGWSHLYEPSGNPNLSVWIPYFLCELACTTCNRTGPRGDTNANGTLLLATERLCDTITVTQGDLGQTGRVNSTGPGSGLVAYVAVEVQGCRLFQLDFQQTDPVGMNCLWAPL